MTRPLMSHLLHRQGTSFLWSRHAALKGPYRGLTWPETRPGVQGLVESRQLKDREGQAYTLCLLARRSRLHPGMRYIARGLNALASPGNEIECDQVRGTSRKM